jgi:hypothetical protein
MHMIAQDPARSVSVNGPDREPVGTREPTGHADTDASLKFARLDPAAVPALGPARSLQCKQKLAVDLL